MSDFNFVQLPHRKCNLPLYTWMIAPIPSIYSLFLCPHSFFCDLFFKGVRGNMDSSINGSNCTIRGAFPCAVCQISRIPFLMRKVCSDFLVRNSCESRRLKVDWTQITCAINFSWFVTQPRSLDSIFVRVKSVYEKRVTFCKCHSFIATHGVSFISV